MELSIAAPLRRGLPVPGWVREWRRRRCRPASAGAAWAAERGEPFVP